MEQDLCSPPNPLLSPPAYAQTRTGSSGSSCVVSAILHLQTSQKYCSGAKTATRDADYTKKLIKKTFHRSQRL